MSARTESDAMGAAELGLARGLREGVGAAAIGVAVTVLAIAGMAVDHLLGSDPGLEDPPMFLIGSGVAVALAALVFGQAVPRAMRADSGAAATRGFLLSGLALVPGMTLVWIGVPFALAGGGVALGLIARERGAGHRATAAIVLGALGLLVATGYYVAEAASKL